MFNQKINATPLAFIVPLLAAFYAAGCGGSASIDGAGGGSGGSGAGAGATNNGGTGGHPVCNGACIQLGCPDGSIPVKEPGACCPTCQSGNGGSSAGGSSSTGGNSSVGGSAGACAGVECPLLGPCPPGTKAVYGPGACCGMCVPDGSGGAGGCAGGVTCPGLLCMQGYHLQQQAGQCCPSCVADTTCDAGQKGYQALRQKLLSDPSAVACKTDKDCALLEEHPFCGDQCSYVSVNASQAPSINDQLTSWDKTNCSTCTPSYPPCVAPPPLLCLNSKCGLANQPD